MENDYIFLDEGNILGKSYPPNMVNCFLDVRLVGSSAVHHLLRSRVDIYRV